MRRHTSKLFYNPMRAMGASRINRIKLIKTCVMKPSWAQQGRHDIAEDQSTFRKPPRLALAKAPAQNPDSGVAMSGATTKRCRIPGGPLVGSRKIKDPLSCCSPCLACSHIRSLQAAFYFTGQTPKQKARSELGNRLTELEFRYGLLRPTYLIN